MSRSTYIAKVLSDRTFWEPTTVKGVIPDRESVLLFLEPKSGVCRFTTDQEKNDWTSEGGWVMRIGDGRIKSYEEVGARKWPVGIRMTGVFGVPMRGFDARSKLAMLHPGLIIGSEKDLSLFRLWTPEEEEEEREYEGEGDKTVTEGSKGVDGETKQSIPVTYAPVFRKFAYNADRHKAGHKVVRVLMRSDKRHFLCIHETHAYQYSVECEKGVIMFDECFLGDDATIVDADICDEDLILLLSSKDESVRGLWILSMLRVTTFHDTLKKNKEGVWKSVLLADVGKRVGVQIAGYMISHFRMISEEPAHEKDKTPDLVIILETGELAQNREGGGSKTETEQNAVLFALCYMSNLKDENHKILFSDVVKLRKTCKTERYNSSEWKSRFDVSIVRGLDSKTIPPSVVMTMILKQSEYDCVIFTIKCRKVINSRVECDEGFACTVTKSSSTTKMPIRDVEVKARGEICPTLEFTEREIDRRQIERSEIKNAFLRIMRITRDDKRCQTHAWDKIVFTWSNRLIFMRLEQE